MPINTSTLITRIVEQTLNKPSVAFGRLVPVVDFVAMGRLAKEYRIKKNVSAKKVAAELKLTKTKFSFLESGVKKWDRKTLEAYLIAVDKFKTDVPLKLQIKEQRQKDLLKRKTKLSKMMKGRAARAAAKAE